MPVKPFDQSRIKLKRARANIGELQNEILAYLKRQPFYLIFQPAPNDTKEWVIRVREEVPVEFSAIIGDVLHNLRAALDLMAVQLVQLNHASDEDVYFPFSKSAAKFDEALCRSANYALYPRWRCLPRDIFASVPNWWPTCRKRNRPRLAKSRTLD